MDGGSSVRALIEKARDGSRGARERLLEPFRDYLRFLARTWIDSALRSKVDASDAAQETLVCAHERFQQFRGGSEAELLGWLRQMLLRRIIDQARRFHTPGGRTVVWERPLSEMLDRSARASRRLLRATQTSPSAWAGRRETSLVLANALAALQPEQRQVIEFRTLAGCSWDEVGQRMGRTAGAVRQLWLRALRRLRMLVEDRP